VGADGGLMGWRARGLEDWRSVIHTSFPYQPAGEGDKRCGSDMPSASVSSSSSASGANTVNSNCCRRILLSLDKTAALH